MWRKCWMCDDAKYINQKWFEMYEIAGNKCVINFSTLYDTCTWLRIISPNREQPMSNHTKNNSHDSWVRMSALCFAHLSTDLNWKQSENSCRSSLQNHWGIFGINRRCVEHFAGAVLFNNTLCSSAVNAHTSLCMIQLLLFTVLFTEHTHTHFNRTNVSHEIFS